jgi:hypothetical protein
MGEEASNQFCHKITFYSDRNIVFVIEGLPIAYF